MSEREYLGDSVYVEMDGPMVKLFTDNGYGARNVIFLEPEVLTMLNDYYDRQLKQKRRADNE